MKTGKNKTQNLIETNDAGNNCCINNLTKKTKNKNKIIVLENYPMLKMPYAICHFMTYETDTDLISVLHA